MECAVSPLLDAYFPPLSGVQVLAQPGAFYVASAFSLATNVIGKKTLSQQWDSLAQGQSLGCIYILMASISLSVVAFPVRFILPIVFQNIHKEQAVCVFPSGRGLNVHG